MPTSSRRKTKGKATRSKPRASVEDDSNRIYTTEIDNCQSWDMITGILCNLLDLPDMSTRSGLKKVHLTFNAIYDRMDAFYQKNMDNIKIRGAMVAIYEKMCIDAILRDKLFNKGVLDRIMPLCQIEDTRQVALRTLNTITHHGGVDVRTEVAKHANKLVKILRDFPDDEKVVEFVVLTLAHSVTAVASSESSNHPVNPEVLEQIDMADVYESVLEAIKRPFSDRRRLVIMINHVIELVAFSCMQTAPDMKAYPPSIGFLVAGIRSKDWIIRCICLGALIRLYHLEAEDDEPPFTQQQLVDAALSRVPPKHLNDILTKYDKQRSGMFLTLECVQDFQEAMYRYLEDEDLHKLGLTQADLIVKTEFAVVDEYFHRLEDPDTRDSEWVDMETHLPPFTRWGDSLPHSARAIRSAGKPLDQDYADILDIKYSFMCGRRADAYDIAKKGIERNPERAYFYYALSLTGDGVQDLRAAKKGMKCKLTTPFLKFSMMKISVYHAANMGYRILQALTEVGTKEWEQGVAFLVSALEDAKAYFDGAPPDTRTMKVGYWLVLLTMVVSENLGPDLRELQPILQKLRITDEFSLFIGTQPRNTNLRLAQQAVVEHYASGLRDYKHVFDIIDQYHLGDETQVVNAEKSGDNLSAWLEDKRLDDSTTEDAISCIDPRKKYGLKVDYDRLTLYRCSWCANPSAVLQKCSRCSSTRYCDKACQKAHWSKHKSECKKYQ